MVRALVSQLLKQSSSVKEVRDLLILLDKFDGHYLKSLTYIMCFWQRSSTHVRVCQKSLTFISKLSMGMSETLFDTLILWSCDIRSGCRTTSLAFFSV
jgi:hypothetical protein